MSTITPLQPMTAAQPFWVPSLPTLYRLSIAQYEAMVASGVFTKRDRLHLINGFLVAKMTEYPPHAAACDGVRFAIEALLPTGWYVRPDKPLKIPNCISVPEPDVVVARGTCATIINVIRSRPRLLLSSKSPARASSKIAGWLLFTAGVASQCTGSST